MVGGRPPTSNRTFGQRIPPPGKTGHNHNRSR